MSGPGGVVWQDPPARRGNRARSAEIDQAVRFLKMGRGRWALVATLTYNGGAEAFRRRGCETTIRRAADGKYEVYARWPKDEP